MYYVIASGKKSSKRAKEYLDKLEVKLQERKIEHKILVCPDILQATEYTRHACQQKDCEAIIALGGDGTFFEVINGLDTRIPVGFIPAGTGNDFARTLGIGLDIDECLDNIMKNEPKYLDYLKIGDKRCFNVAGSGFDIQLLKREEKIRHKYKGRTSYHIALFQTILFLKFNKIKYRIDDEEEWHEQKFFMMDACNGRWGGGMMPICIDAEPHDGLMDFVVIDKFPRIKLLPLLLTFQKGLLYKKKYYHHYKCKKVEIDIEPKLEINLDGELFNMFPVTIEIVHNECKYFPSSKQPVDPLTVLGDRKLRKTTV